MDEETDYIDSIIAMDAEIDRILSLWDRGCPDDKQGFIAARRRTNELLLDAIKKHDRVLRFLAGEHIEPIAHSAEAVITGFGGA